jgi:HSP20 family molecular chaperone IbpA
MDAMDALNGATLKRPTTTLAQNRRVSAPDLSVTKKLKRMPHLFTRVLELPLHAETPVSVVESRDSFRFEVRLPGLHVEDVKVEVLEIVPGATKVLVRGVGHCSPHADVAEVR